MRWLIVILFTLISCTAQVELENYEELNNNTIEIEEELEDSLSNLQELDLEIKQIGDVSYLELPINKDCGKTKASPIVVENNIYFPLAGKKCSQEELFGIFMYDTKKEEMFHAPIGNAEGTMAYVEEHNLLLFPRAEDKNKKNLYTLSQELSIISSVEGLKANIDTAALFLDEHIYFGTANPSLKNCQTPINEDCGIVVKSTIEGDIVSELGLEQGYRTWLVGSPVSDGEHIYITTAKQAYGEVGVYDFEAEEYRYGCSILKLDKDLNIIAYDDPDQAGCTKSTNKLLAVATGELAIGPDGLWAQFSGPGAENLDTAVIKYDFDMNEMCRATFNTPNGYFVSGHYRAPTIDHEGNVYVAFYSIQNGGSSSIHKITNNCTSEELFNTQTPVESSLTLADNTHILIASAGELLVYTMQGEYVNSYALPTNAEIVASPIIHNGTVHIIAEDGTYSMIEGIANNYGDAYWPRLRKDNIGSATS
jgi:hypothetical protein